MKHCFSWLILFSFIIVTLAGCKSADEHNETLQNNDTFSTLIKSIDKVEVSLQEVAPFDWDKFYVFAPYTTKEHIEDILKFKDKEIKSTIDEAMLQLIFVTDENKIVCYIYGYADDLGYEISFDAIDDYLTFSSTDNVHFEVVNDNDFILLSHIK